MVPESAILSFVTEIVLVVGSEWCVDFFHDGVSDLIIWKVLLKDFSFDVLSLVVGNAVDRLNNSDVEILDDGTLSCRDVEELLEIDTKVIVDLLVGMNT